jgi:hypothetical protein
MVKPGLIRHFTLEAFRTVAMQAPILFEMPRKRSERCLYGTPKVDEFIAKQYSGPGRYLPGPEKHSN